DRIVEVQYVDAVPPQPLQTRFDRGTDRRRRVGHILGAQAKLGPDDDFRPRPQVTHDLTEMLLRKPIAVRGRRIEVGDPGVERARDRLPLLGRVAADHQSADRPTTEPKRRYG